MKLFLPEDKMEQIIQMSLVSTDISHRSLSQLLGMCATSLAVLLAPLWYQQLKIRLLRRSSVYNNLVTLDALNRGVDVVEHTTAPVKWQGCLSQGTRHDDRHRCLLDRLGGVRTPGGLWSPEEWKLYIKST